MSEVLLYTCPLRRGVQRPGLLQHVGVLCCVQVQGYLTDKKTPPRRTLQ